MPTSGAARAAARSRSTACGRTIVSLFNSRVPVGSDGLHPEVVARGEAAVAGRLDESHGVPVARRHRGAQDGDAVVTALVVDDDDAIGDRVDLGQDGLDALDHQGGRPVVDDRYREVEPLGHG